ncbi:MAG: transposase [Micromonosporaceae bacterium]
MTNGGDPHLQVAVGHIRGGGRRVAMVRMYCGLAAADVESQLTAAVVDDSGRLMDIQEFGDDPAGYAHLGTMLAERSDGSPVAVASDHANHLVTQLLMAVGRPLGIADHRTTETFAEHFTDDSSPTERQAPPALRRAVGLARALQAGAISAIARNPSPDLSALKPVLAAHAAVTAGRQAAAAARREVLRELYPAALRAYPDPAEGVPLAVLDALPEPSLVADPMTDHTFDGDLIRELTGTGLIDPAAASHAITALRVAISDLPQRPAQRALAPMVAATVRHAVAAVRACDAAAIALVGTLAERLGATAPIHPMSPFGPPGARPAAPPTPPTPAAEVPPSRLSPRRSAASAAAAGVGAAPYPPAYEPAYAAAASLQPGPGFGTNPGYVAAFETERGYSSTAIPGPRPEPGYPPPGSRQDWPTDARDSDYAVPPVSPGPFLTSFDLDPLNAPLSPALPPVSSMPVSPGRVPPPWPDPPADPPSLRLVESAADPLTDPIGFDRLREPYFEPPALRVIDGEGNRGNTYLPGAGLSGVGNGGSGNGYAGASGGTTYTPGRPEGSGSTAAFGSSGTNGTTGTNGTNGSNGGHAADGDLLIFSETASSAWFTQYDEENQVDALGADWGEQADEGWRSAEQASRPAVGAETMAGLPRRVPQANLVPGSVLPPPRPLRIVRDAASIAAHTTGYFRGWRRGQEIGGFAVGQRDRAAWEFNREQRSREADQRVRRP